MKITITLFLAAILCSLSAQISDSYKITPLDLDYDLETMVFFGSNVTNVGDINKDGFEDIAFTAFDNFRDSSLLAAGFWLGFLDGNGNIDTTFRYENFLDYLPENYNEIVPAFDILGDVDRNGRKDFVLGFNYFERDSIDGLVSIMTINGDRSIKSFKSYTAADIGLDNLTDFGYRVKNVGDIDANGFNDIAVTLRYYNRDSLKQGAIALLFMDSDGELLSSKIIENEFIESDIFYGFGYKIKGNEDFNNDGFIDLLIGSPHSNLSGQEEKGSCVILYLNDNADVISSNVISAQSLLFDDNYFDGDPHFGESLASIGDLDNDGISEILVSACWSEYSIYHGGMLFAISLNQDGSLKAYAPVFDPIANDLNLIEHDHLGEDLDVLKDFNGDGLPEIITFLSESYDDNPGAGHIRFIHTDFSNLLNIITSNKKILSNKDFTIFPNPSADYIQLTIEGMDLFKFEIINANGQIVDSDDNVRNSIKVDISNLPSGLYWVKLETERAYTYKSVIKK